MKEGAKESENEGEERRDNPFDKRRKEGRVGEDGSREDLELKFCKH